MHRNETRQLEDIPSHDLGALNFKFEERTRKFGCHAVLVRPSFEKKCGRNYSILLDRKFANLRQQLEAKTKRITSAGLGKGIL